MPPPPEDDPIKEPPPPIEDPIREPPPPTDDIIREPPPPTDDPIKEPPPPTEDIIREPPPPTDDIIREPPPPEDDIIKEPRPPEVKIASGELTPPKEAPRPPGTFPREVGHIERVEYSYDPQTGVFDAKLVSSTEPVVTAWDRTVPTADERPVGGWAVTPTPNSVEAEQGESPDLEVPEAVQEQLVKEAGDSDETVTVGADVRYAHDLDTLDTQVRINPDAYRPKEAPIEAPDGDLAGMFNNSQEDNTQNGATEQDSGSYSREKAAALVAQSQLGHPQTLDDLASKYQGLKDKFAQSQVQQRQSTARRRASRRAEKQHERQELPEIVLVQEGVGGRRVGGL